MGFMKVQMGYIWGTFLFTTGYITGVHCFPPAIEDLIGKANEIKLLLLKTTQNFTIFIVGLALLFVFSQEALY